MDDDLGVLLFQETSNVDIVEFLLESKFRGFNFFSTVSIDVFVARTTTKEL